MEKYKKAKLNDQAPKPALGNMKGLHGKVNTDNAGGSNPATVNPSKKRK